MRPWISSWHSHFDSDDIGVAAAREGFVLRALSSSAVDEVNAETLRLPTSMNAAQLTCQLTTLSAAFETPPNNLREACEKISTMEEGTKVMFGEVRKALSLTMSLPCTVASCERSFSMLRRLKTYLRSTMGQPRLNHLALMHIYREKVEDVDMDALMRTFVKRNAERMRTFGNL